jgi:hypothetical protein
VDKVNRCVKFACGGRPLQPGGRGETGEGELFLDEMLQPLIDWLHAQPFQQTFAGTFWIVPTAQTIHILCVAIVMTGALVIALRGMGLAGKEWSLARWQVRFHGATVAALWVLLATGIVMTIAEPERELLNIIFRAKMLAVIVTLIVEHFLSRSLRAATSDRPVGVGVRLVAVLVLLSWMGIAAAGRWIAYAG